VPPRLFFHSKSSHRPVHQVLSSPNIYNTSPPPSLSSLTPTPFPHPSSLPILFPSSKTKLQSYTTPPYHPRHLHLPIPARPFLAPPRSIPTPSIFASSSPHPTSTLVLARERVLVLACLLPVDVCLLLYGWQRMGGLDGVVEEDGKGGWGWRWGMEWR